MKLRLNSWWLLESRNFRLLRSHNTQKAWTAAKIIESKKLRLPCWYHPGSLLPSPKGCVKGWRTGLELVRKWRLLSTRRFMIQSKIQARKLISWWLLSTRGVMIQSKIQVRKLIELMIIKHKRWWLLKSLNFRLLRSHNTQKAWKASKIIESKKLRLHSWCL